MSLSVPTTTVLDQDLGELDPEVAADDLSARVARLAAKHPLHPHL